MIPNIFLENKSWNLDCSQLDNTSARPPSPKRNHLKPHLHQLWSYLDLVSFFREKGIEKNIRREMSWRILVNKRHMIYDIRRHNEFHISGVCRLYFQLSLAQDKNGIAYVGIDSSYAFYHGICNICKK